MDFSADALAVMAENMLLVQQVVSRGRLHRVLSVLKMRFSSHDQALREMRIAPPDGIRTLTPAESGREVLEGLTHQWTGLTEGSKLPLSHWEAEAEEERQ